ASTQRVGRTASRWRELHHTVGDTDRPGPVVRIAALVDVRLDAADRYDGVRHARGQARRDDGEDVVQHLPLRIVVLDVGVARALRRADPGAVVHRDQRL